MARNLEPCMDPARDLMHQRFSQYFSPSDEDLGSRKTGTCYVCGATIEGYALPNNRIACQAQLMLMTKREQVEKGQTPSPDAARRKSDKGEIATGAFNQDFSMVVIGTKRTMVLSNLAPAVPLPDTILALHSADVRPNGALAQFMALDTGMIELAVLFSRQGSRRYAINTDPGLLPIHQNNSVTKVPLSEIERCRKIAATHGIADFETACSVRKLFVQGDRRAEKEFKALHARNPAIVAELAYLPVRGSDVYYILRTLLTETEVQS